MTTFVGTSGWRLREPEEPVARLMERAARLGDKLGPILLQLPPTLRADADLLDRCLRCFAPDVRLVDRLGRPMTPLWRTADWGYLRLHEGRAKQWPCYGRQALRTWAERLAETWSADDEVFVTSTTIPAGRRSTIP